MWAFLRKSASQNVTNSHINFNEINSIRLHSNEENLFVLSVTKEQHCSIALFLSWTAERKKNKQTSPEIDFNRSLYTISFSQSMFRATTRTDLFGLNATVLWNEISWCMKVVWDLALDRLFLRSPQSQPFYCCNHPMAFHGVYKNPKSVSGYYMILRLTNNNFVLL